MCEICLKLKIKTPKRRSGIFIVKFKHLTFSCVSTVNFEQVNFCLENCSWKSGNSEPLQNYSDSPHSFL